MIKIALSVYDKNKEEWMTADRIDYIMLQKGLNKYFNNPKRFEALLKMSGFSLKNYDYTMLIERGY